MSGIILSHNLTAVFVTIILAVWAILQFKSVLNKKAIFNIVLAAITTIGVTASYTFAFIEANIVQTYQIPKNSEYQMEEFAKQTFEPVDFFMPYDVKKGVSLLFHLDWNTEIWRPGAIGIFLLAILFLAAKTRKRKKNKVLRVAFCISVLLYLCMFIGPIVKWAGKFISFMQFGWRLLLFCMFAFSVYAAYLLHFYFKKRWQTVFVILAILTACYTVGPRYVYQMYLDYKGMEYIKTINEEFYEHYIMEYSPNSADALYLPDLYKERGERVDCNHKDVRYEFIREDNKCRLMVSNNSYNDTMFELPLYYYKGYAAVDKNTGSRLTVLPSENKLVTVSLNDGMHEADLEIWYHGTPVQQLGNLISGLTLLLLFLCGVFHLKVFRSRKE